MTPLNERMIEALSVAIVGMGTVFLSLWVIGEVFAVLMWWFRQKAPPSAAESAPATKKSRDRESQRLVAVIAAAATVAAGRRVAVHRVTYIAPDTVSGWAEAGRSRIQSSHSLRRGY
ncbi:Oxaloacetate decarboxylase, gamma chain [Posidoniimonas polymericola]|uniref:Oxaloacetate decarboxylase, gamma chain n=1 Tax=Posidoniimonas polymericola TaxID=2528002 RepID=A0A5C5XUI7_9BACT|nr:OadG family protein [Posidoniimonas polymericola]TWT66966.1 Oxaloacetate decarboxylase, gamma chain [Posidoniimonas polymericola]